MRNSSNYKNFILFSVKAINVLCCCIIVFSLITSNSRKRSEIVQLKIPLNLKLQNQCYQCKNNSIQKNIFFLKTHKTASTTVQNIIMRFGYKHSLNFLLPKKHNYIGYYDPITESDMDENAIPLDRKFNIFTHHTKYRNSTDQFLYKNTIKVTILRNPPELFESLFTFYKFKKKYNITFQEFLISLPRIKIDGLKKGKKFGYNQMCRDLGLQPELQRDETAIRKFITKIDKEFDLVMIKEHLEGSLVLLKNLMGWPLEYVSFIPLNSRTDTIKYKLSEMDRFILSQMNYADTLLYEHFANKIRSCIVKYGENHLLDEVQKLYIINENLKNRCIQETDLKEMEINNETEQLHSMDSEKQIIMKDTKDLSVIDYAEKITCCGNWNNERFLKGCKWSPDEIGNRVLVLDGDNKLKIFHCFLNKIDYNKSQISSDNYELSCIGNIYDYDWYPLIEPSQYYIIVASSLGPVHIYDMTISKSISSYQMYNTNDEAIYAHCVTCSPDGMTVLSGTTDYIFIFDTNRPGKMFNRILTRPYFKRGIISSISINPMRNSMFAVGSYNSRIGIYDETKLLCMLYGHAKGVTQLKFSNNGLFLYSGVRGSSEIICWDLRNPGTALFRLDRVVKTQQRIYFDITPDSRYVFSGNTNGYVYIWDTLLPPKGQVLPFFHKFQAHSDCTNGISIHKQLPFFATVSGQYHNPVFLLDSDNDDKEDDNQIFICEEENSLKLWHMNRN